MKTKQTSSETKRHKTKLYQVLSLFSSTEEARSFFEDLCSPAELQAMADRWHVVGLLEKGKSYRDIQEITGISVTTVGRIARCLNMGEGGYQAALSQGSD